MAEIVRTLRVDEFDPLMRLLERCFGHSYGFFVAQFPHLCRPTPELAACSHIVEVDGKIASHVAVFPLQASCAGIPLKIGGISAVSTAPEYRGKGYMSRLLKRVVDVMREEGYTLSWLGGDRQRYNAYGWEMAGQAYTLAFTRRSLDWGAVKAFPIEQRRADEVVDTIASYQSSRCCHIQRPDLARQLTMQGIRIWTSPDGYAIIRGGAGEKVEILEIVSSGHHEIGMIRGLMEWCASPEVTWRIPACDTDVLSRVMPYAGQWQAGPNHMYRIIDLAALLESAKPWLDARAAGLKDMALCFALNDYDRTTHTTLEIRSGECTISRNGPTAPKVSLTAVEAARVFLGGPATAIASQVSPQLATLLPLPAWVDPLDQV